MAWKTYQSCSVLVKPLSDTAVILVHDSIEYHNERIFWLFIIIIIFIKTLFTLGLERKIYKNEIITAKDKRVIHASRSRGSLLQAIPQENSNPKNANAPNRKPRKLTYLLLWI